jgi:hypothetical protein
VQNLDASGAPKGEPLAEVKGVTAKDEELSLSLDLLAEQLSVDDWQIVGKSSGSVIWKQRAILSKSWR